VVVLNGRIREERMTDSGPVGTDMSRPDSLPTAGIVASSGKGPDASWLRERLAQCIWREDEPAGHVVDVRIRQKRQSRNGTTALCAVDLSGSDGRRVEQLYLLHQMPAEALDTEAPLAFAEATVVPRLGRAVTLVPEANLLLVAFPNDRQMRLVTEASLQEWLNLRATTLANDGRRGPRWQLQESSFEVLRYAPGQRLTMRCKGRFVSERGFELPFGYIAKQFRKAKWARTLHQNLVALDRHLAKAATVRVPKPIALDEELGLVLMEELPGRDLKRALPDLDVLEAMSGAGALLAAFHQVPRRVPETISVRKEIEEVQHSAKRIERFFPAAIPRLAACLSRCLATEWTDEVPTVLLHGAFRPKHVWVHAGKLALIDIDGIRMGHPAYDLGHFLSSLYYLETQGHLDAAQRRAAARRFMEGYSTHAPWQLRPAAVLWFFAALLMHKQARKYVMHLHDDRAEKVDRVLRLAEHALETCQNVQGDTPLDVIWSVLD
jgi:Ser/Thr protein kinase RdoA (MazF antagonist)